MASPAGQRTGRPAMSDAGRELQQAGVDQALCAGDCCAAPAPIAAVRDEAWLRDARWARALSWASLIWMTIEGAAGLAAGFRSEERRVGKECRSRWSACQKKK